MTWVAIAFGAAAGAPARFAVDRWFLKRRGTGLPYGTFAVNMVGSLLLGLITGLTLGVANGATGGWALLMDFLGIGFCGALTTFSGFASQTLELTRAPRNWKGPAYALVSVTLGFALASAGYALLI